MRIDLPGCDMKYCRYCLDGNCSSKNRYLTCNYTIKKLQLENSNANWNIYSFPKKDGIYPCLLLNGLTLETNIENIEFKNKEFYYDMKTNIFLGWKDGE